MKLWRVFDDPDDNEPDSDVIDRDGDVWRLEGEGDEQPGMWRCWGQADSRFSITMSWGDLVEHEEYGPVHIVLPEERFLVYDREMPREING